jgi:hypothetical protein
MARIFVDSILNEIARAWSDVLHTPLELICDQYPILNSQLSGTIRVPSAYSWTEAVQAFGTAANRTQVVYSYWVGDDGHLYVKVGREVLSSIRTDRGLASRVYTIRNNEPFASHKRLQLLQIKAERPHPSTVAISMEPQMEQLIANYLLFSLRMNPQDIHLALTWMRESRCAWSDLTRIDGKFKPFR